MKYRILLTTIMYILFSYNLSAQLKKDRIVLNSGIQRSSLYNNSDNKEKLYYIKKLKPANFIDLNITYEFNSKISKLFPSLGIGFTQKGYEITRGNWLVAEPPDVGVEKYSYLFSLSEKILMQLTSFASTILFHMFVCSIVILIIAARHKRKSKLKTA